MIPGNLASAHEEDSPEAVFDRSFAPISGREPVWKRSPNQRGGLRNITPAGR